MVYFVRLWHRKTQRVASEYNTCLFFRHFSFQVLWLKWKITVPIHQPTCAMQSDSNVPTIRRGIWSLHHQGHCYTLKMAVSSPAMFVNFNYTNFFIIKPTRCTDFPNLLRHENSTCFGQFLCPSIIRSLFTLYSALEYVIQVCRQLSSTTRM